MAAGDIAIYRESGGGGVFGTTAAKHAWDTPVTEGTPYSLGSGTDVTISEAGYYLVIHNIGIETQAAQTGRSKVLSYVDISGAEQPHGRGAGFISRAQSVNDGGGWSAGIFRVEEGEVVSIKSWHSDSNTTDPPKESADRSGLQLLQLSDAQPILRLVRAVISTASSSSWSNVNWQVKANDSVTDTIDAFGWVATPTPQDIELKQAGKYLVTCTIGVNVSTTSRIKAEVRMTLGGIEVPRSYASDHINGAGGCNDGVVVSTFILDNPTANQDLVVQYRHSTTGPATFTATALVTTIAMQKIPDWPETIRTSDAAGGAALSTTGNFSWDTAAEYDESDQDSFTFTAPSVTILADQTDNYLFLGSLFGERPSGSSAVAFQPLVQVNAVNLTYGFGNGYSRGTDELAAQATFGGIIQATATNAVITKNIARGAVDAGFVAVADRSGCEIINIASLYGAPKFVPDTAEIALTAGEAVPNIDTYAPLVASIRFQVDDGTIAVQDEFYSPSTAVVTLGASDAVLDATNWKTPTVAGITLSSGIATTPYALRPASAAAVVLSASIATEVSSDGVSNLTYSPVSGDVVKGDALTLTASITGQAASWEVLTNPWDAVQCPGPDQDPDSELYVPYADPDDAYLEVKQFAVRFLQGPYVHSNQGGINPVNRTAFQLDTTTPWTGIATADTMGDRYGFGVAGQTNNFNPLAEGIYWAGSTEADDYRDAENRIIIRVLDNVAFFNQTNLKVGGPGTTASNQEAWWTVEPGKASILDTPRRISGLWIIGASASLGSLGSPARTAAYRDVIASMTFGELYRDFTTGAPSDFSVDDITFQGLSIQAIDGGSDRAFGGTGDYESPDVAGATQVRHGLIRLFDCQVRGTYGSGGHADFLGVDLGMKFGMRFFHSRGMYHLHNVHFEPCQEHCVYVDYINDGLVANLPAHYKYRSYFKKITMDYGGRTMFQLVSRANELADDPGGNTNERIEPMASGLVVFEECHGESLIDNSSMITIVNHRRENRGFIEDGTILLRNCTQTETATNHLAGKTGPPFLVWQDADSIATNDHGVVFDEEGFGTTRVVIDGFKTFNQSGLPDLELVSDNLFETTGLGELQIWNFHDVTKWSVGNVSPGGRIFGIDLAVSDPLRLHDFGRPENWNSNNPPFNTNAYGTSDQGSCPGFDRCAGSYNPMSGPVRFFVDPLDLPNQRLSQSSAWGAGVRFAVSSFLSTTPTPLNSQQIDALQASIPALPAGISIQDALAALPGNISGTPTAAAPNLSPGSDKHFVQNFLAGYLQPMDWDDSVYFGVQATHNANTALELVKIKVTGDGPNVADPAQIALSAPGGVKVIHNEDFPAVVASIALSAGTASALYGNLYNFATGVNLTQLQYYRWPIGKDAFTNSRTYQFRSPTGVILPPNVQTGGVTVPLDLNDHPDFNDFPTEQIGYTVVSGVQVLPQPYLYPAGDWSLRWTGTGTMDFAPGNARGEITAGGVDQNFIKRTMDPTGGPLYVQVLTGPVDNVRCYHPGYDPLDDPNSSQAFHPKLVERLVELVSAAGTLRVYDWTGERHCGTGSYDGTGTTTLQGWLPDPNGAWPHKDLADPRQSEWPDQSLSGVAYEVMVGICNATGRWMHWTCPHEYDVAQITAALTFIRDNLVVGLGVVIEWGNEVWNSQFPAYAYIRSQPGVGNVFPLNPAYTAFVATKYQELFDVANTVFAAAPNRRVLYVAGWTGFVDFQIAVLAGITSVVDAAGPACYVNINAEISAGNYDASTTADNLLDDLIANIALTEAKLVEHKASSDAQATRQGFPCAMYLYEGGQSIVPDLDPGGFTLWLEEAKLAQFSPRMGDFYDLLQEALDRVGVSFVCWFNSFDTANDQFGSFGHLYDPYRHVVGDGQSPKWEAIVRNATTNPAVRMPVVASITLQADAATLNGLLFPPTPILTLAASSVPSTYTAGPASIALGASKATYATIGVRSAATAVISLLAAPPARAGNTYYPTTENLGYALPESTSHARSFLNVFANGIGVSSLSGPILISCKAGSFASSDGLDVIWEDDYLEWDWISRGGFLIVPSISGIGESGLYDGYQTPLWESLNQNHIPEKDAAMIVKWTREFATSYGGDTSFISWAGVSSGGWVGALLLGQQRDFVLGTSAHSLQSTKLDALVWISPVTWLDAINHLFPGDHWPSASGFPATTIGDIPSAIIEAVSADEAFREQGFAATTPVFMATSESASSLDITRDDGGVGATAASDPTLQNTLDFTTELHSVWHLLIASQTLRNQVGDKYHGTGVSDFLLDNQVGVVPAGLSNLITGRFDDGVFGEELRGLASDWLWEIYNRREPDTAVISLRASDPETRRNSLPAELILSASQAVHQQDNIRAVVSAAISLQAPRTNLAKNPDAAVITLGVRQPVAQTGNLDLPAEVATITFKAAPVTTSETRYYEGALAVSVGGFVKAQIKKGNPNDLS